MNNELMAMVRSHLAAISGNINQDSQRLASILPALTGVGLGTSTMLGALGGLVETHYREQLLQRKGPTAEMLRQRARVGEGLRRIAYATHSPQGSYTYEATIDNSMDKAEEAIVLLSPKQAEGQYDLTEALQVAIVPYVACGWHVHYSESRISKVPYDVHPSYNYFEMQPLRGDLPAEDSPYGSLTLSSSRTNETGIEAITLNFKDPGGSRRSVSFSPAGRIYNLKTTIYDALEDLTYAGRSSHFTPATLQYAVDQVFEAAGWSREVYEANCWTEPQWAAAFRAIRYVGSEPQPLTSQSTAKTVASDYGFHTGYSEYLDEEGQLHWYMKQKDWTFTGVLSDDAEKCQGPYIIKEDRYGNREDTWTIRAHCLPNLLGTLMPSRKAWLERLTDYWDKELGRNGRFAGDRKSVV